MNRFVIGDIHGRVKALEQCLERSGFDIEIDTLICLGDVCDRGSYVKESIELLLQIKNLIYILGNHDKWFLEWAVTGKQDRLWEYQGGTESVKSYKGEKVPESHIQLFQNASMYYLMDNKLFVHAGIVPEIPLEEQSEYDLLWNRGLVESAIDSSTELQTSYDEIYVGHTPTTIYGYEEPVLFKGVWMMDTGAGWNGKLSILDIDTKKFWQSDKVGS